MDEDTLKTVMEETGLSVIDLLTATIDIAHQEYPSELVRRCDHIIQGLYGSVQCLECTNMEQDQVTSTGALVAEMENQTWNMDRGKSKLSDPREVVMKENSNQERLPERRRPLRVVIRLKNNKNVVPKKEDFAVPKKEDFAVPKKEDSAVPKKEDFAEKRFEDTKRKL